MNPEPLTKEKIWQIDIVAGDLVLKRDNFEEIVHEDTKVVKIEDVKTTVEWLLKEIEKEIKKIEITLSKFICECSDEDYLRGVRNGFIASTKLIKKAFEGVLRE